MKQCKKHPKYRGKKQPPYECTECLHIYFTLKGHRVPIPPPNKVIPDKTKYSRNKKHKQKNIP